MSPRGYTLIYFAYPRRLGEDWDAIIRFMEYVRINFRSIVPGIPAESELDLMAGGTAHNVGLLPLLGLYLPDQSADLPPFDIMIAKVSEWSDSLSDDEFWAIVNATEAPTWVELQSMHVHPAR